MSINHLWVKGMTEKKDRERVIAEITLSHLIRLGNEQGCPWVDDRLSHFSSRRGERSRCGSA